MSPTLKLAHAAADGLAAAVGRAVRGQGATNAAESAAAGASLLATQPRTFKAAAGRQRCSRAGFPSSSPGASPPAPEMEVIELNEDDDNDDEIVMIVMNERRCGSSDIDNDGPAEEEQEWLEEREASSMLMELPGLHLPASVALSREASFERQTRRLPLGSRRLPTQTHPSRVIKAERRRRRERKRYLEAERRRKAVVAAAARAKAEEEERARRLRAQREEQIAAAEQEARREAARRNFIIIDDSSDDDDEEDDEDEVEETCERQDESDGNGETRRKNGTHSSTQGPFSSCRRGGGGSDHCRGSNSRRMKKLPGKTSLRLKKRSIVEPDDASVQPNGFQKRRRTTTTTKKRPCTRRASSSSCCCNPSSESSLCGGGSCGCCNCSGAGYYRFDSRRDYNWNYSQAEALEYQERLFQEAAERLRKKRQEQQQQNSSGGSVGVGGGGPFSSNQRENNQQYYRNHVLSYTRNTHGIPLITEPVPDVARRFPLHWTWSRDPYAALGLPPGSALSLIRKQYRNLARAYHPDKSKTSATIPKFHGISRAYRKLTAEV